MTPADILHHQIARDLGAEIVGKRTGHAWEQTDLPLYLHRTDRLPLLNLANTAPLLYKNNFITIHDLAFVHHPEWFNRSFAAWYNFLIPNLAKRAKHVFTVSNTVKQEIIAAYGLEPDQISVTYNGISPTFGSASYSESACKEKIILTVGSINPRKNHSALISAFLQSRLANEYRLIIAGDRSKSFAETDIPSAGTKTNQVQILEGITENELVSWYKKAEIVASVSHYEGFGIPPLEGIYFGCKIVCSDIPVYRELYGEVATFCNQNESRSIATALQQAADQRVLNPGIVKTLLERYNYGRAAEIILKEVCGS